MSTNDRRRSAGRGRGLLAACGTAAVLAVSPAGATTSDSVERELTKWSQATRSRPQDANVWNALGRAHMQASREGEAEARWGDAERAFGTAYSLDSRNAAAAGGLAWVFNSRHEFERGVAWAEKALALDPAMQEAHALLGDAAAERGHYGAALDHYQRALDLGPNLMTTSRAAHALFMTGEVNAALRLMERAVVLGGAYRENRAWCRAALANMLFHIGALGRAEAHTTLGLRETPDHSHLLLVEARIRAAQGRLPAALASARRSLEVEERHDAFVLLGDLLWVTDARREAEEIFDRLVSFHESTAANAASRRHAASHHRHGQGNAQLASFLAEHDRDLGRALEEAERSYAHHKNVYAADALAWTYFKHGRYEEARAILRDTLRWNTPDARLLFHAGMIHAKLGEQTKARTYLSRALELNPRFDPVLATIAETELQRLATDARGAKD